MRLLCQEEQTVETRAEQIICLTRYTLIFVITYTYVSCTTARLIACFTAEGSPTKPVVGLTAKRVVTFRAAGTAALCR